MLASTDDGVKTLATYLVVRTDVSVPEPGPLGWELELFRSMDPELLSYVMRYSIVPGRMEFSRLARQERVVTLNTKSVMVSEHGLLNETYEIIEPDIPAANGLIHTLDFMLLPPDFPNVLENNLQADIAA